MVANYKEYETEKRKFFEKHNYDYRVETSPMDDAGCYTKSYMFEDNHCWCEKMSPSYEEVEVEVKRVIVKLEVKMLKTEYWSTEARSKYYYEKF